jgi:hypothetical protein
MAAVLGLGQTSLIQKNPLPSLSISLKAQEYLGSLKKGSIVVVKILMLYLFINNLCIEVG